MTIHPLAWAVLEAAKLMVQRERGETDSHPHWHYARRFSMVAHEWAEAGYPIQSDD